MERFYSKIVGMPVLVDGSLRPITSVRDLVIDPDNGKVLAFVTDLVRNLVIMEIDVVKIGAAILIHDHNSVIEGQEVVKVDRIQQKGCRYIEAPVETESGEKLGKVYDLTVDLKQMKVKNLYVAKGFLGLVRYMSRIIPANQIVEVLEDKIVVKDSVVTVKDEEKMPIQDAATT